ncbi:MAG: HD domain-containing protein [Nanoarchaeota archaeon]|nr:HD domain-containing protein [Nanoarchaeota archaeon]
MVERQDKIIAFLKEVEKFKLIEREMFCSDLKRRESDADHSWHLAMFAILFEKDLPENLDMVKMLKLALIHDLVEIYAGDTFAFDKEGKKTKKDRELESSKKLFSQLPADLEREFIGLFEDYENSNSSEAKIIKSFDKIQPILQNLCSEGKAWKNHHLNYEDIDNYKRKHMTHNKMILNIYDCLMNEAKDKNYLK